MIKKTGLYKNGNYNKNIKTDCTYRSYNGLGTVSLDEPKEKKKIPTFEIFSEKVNVPRH